MNFWSKLIIIPPKGIFKRLWMIWKTKRNTYKWLVGITKIVRIRFHGFLETFRWVFAPCFHIIFLFLKLTITFWLSRQFHKYHKNPDRNKKKRIIQSFFTTSRLRWDHSTWPAENAERRVRNNFILTESLTILQI